MATGQRKFTRGELISALRKHGGIQAEAARELGVNRSAVCKRIRRDPSLAAELREIEAEHLDEAEGVIRAAIRAGDLATSRWYLDRRGKHLGYGASATVRLSDRDIEEFVAELSKADPETLRRLAANE